MKKFLTKLIGNTINYGLLFILAYSVFTNSPSLLRVTAAAYWVIMMLALIVGPLLYFMTYAAKVEKDVGARKKIVDQFSESLKKKSAFHRTLRWIELIIISCLLAYSGWVFTSVIYVITSLWLRLFISMGRDNIAFLEEKDKNIGVDGWHA